MIDVVEVQPQHEARERRRIVGLVKTYVFALIDDDADQRHHAPHGKQRHAEPKIGQARQQRFKRRANRYAGVGSRCHDFSSNRIIQMLAS